METFSIGQRVVVSLYGFSEHAGAGYWYPATIIRIMPVSFGYDRFIVRLDNPLGAEAEFTILNSTRMKPLY